jgi:hypothetical protein
LPYIGIKTIAIKIAAMIIGIIGTIGIIRTIGITAIMAIIEVFRVIGIMIIGTITDNLQV